MKAGDMIKNRSALPPGTAAGGHAEGVPDISRGLRSAERDDTPGNTINTICTLERCRTRLRSFRLNVQFCDPFRVVAATYLYRGSLLALRPPANIWQPPGWPMSQQALCCALPPQLTGVFGRDLRQPEDPLSAERWPTTTCRSGDRRSGSLHGTRCLNPD
jgi:hypothetical protein